MIRRMDAETSDWAPGYAGPGTYRHKKGGIYRVLGLGTHEGTGAPFVVYAPASESADGPPRFWLRPRDDFDDTTEGVARFQRIS